VERFDERYRLRADDVIVLTTQPWGRLVTYLLEPESDDGLARWGSFDDLKAGDVYPIRRWIDEHDGREGPPLERLRPWSP
jgi:hypothetical protein